MGSYIFKSESANTWFRWMEYIVWIGFAQVGMGQGDRHPKTDTSKSDIRRK